MTLIDHYRADIAARSGADRKAARALWHNTAKRILHMLQLTSDPIPPPSSRRVKISPTDMSPNAPTYRITTIPFLPFFLRFSEDELEDLYRLTKPVKPRPDK